MKKVYFTIVVMSMIIIIALGISGYRACSVGTGELRKVRSTVTDKGIKRINEEDKSYIREEDQ